VEHTIGTLLMIDVGNTNAVFGVSASELDDAVDPVWRFSSSRERMPDEWFALLHPLIGDLEISAAIISSVVPAITRNLVELCRRHLGLEPTVVGAQLDLGISIQTDAPSEVGTDRLVNSAYAFARWGGPCIVVDLGTATKIEAIASEGAYLGGVIAPGLGLTLEALATRAARLYAVELKTPPTAIGRNTVHAVQSGVVGGHLAMIEGMVARVQSELDAPARAIVLTGGFAATVADSIPIATDYVPDLTLRGLRYLYFRNTRAGSGAIVPGEEMTP
jgi:type III pantothenate kinase